MDQRKEIIVKSQTIIINDCIDEMSNYIEKESIDVVVTSPPYNLNINYNIYSDNLSNEDYLKWIEQIAICVNKVLTPDGSFFLNVGSTCKEPYIAIDILNTIRKTEKFKLQNNIVWVKSISIKDESFGHFKPITSNRFLNHNYESVFHFTKTGKVSIDKLSIGVPYTHKSNIDRWKNKKIDKRCKGDTWFIPYETVTKSKEHPAAFPKELVRNCLKLYGIKKDMKVLDPFLGSGTTLKVCDELGVIGFGIELDESYLSEFCNKNEFSL